jgi:tRNA-specific 2-thiouridylase
MIANKPKIAVAMSGGVDSSVSAMLLQEKGYETVGFHMNLGCDLSSSAKKVAEALGMTFFEVDGKKVFQKEVINYFISEYKNLRTPNPCVMCNKLIKFGWLLETVRKKKFDLMATGHYARIKKDKNGISHLLTGYDKTKDQSYFLYRLDQAQLAKVIFPLGEFSKEEIKKIAKKRKLPCEKSESQEVCFITDESYREFLKKHLPEKCFQSGRIINTKGEIIGQHDGLINYTIGQRKGINQVGIRDDNRKPLYVVGFNQKKNELIVGEDDDLLKKEVVAGDLSWVSPWAKEKALANKNIKARIRYRHIQAHCSVKIIGKKLQVTFETSQRAIVPGQSLVLYSGEEVLGGGVIG